MLHMFKPAAKAFVRKATFLPYGWSAWNDVKRLSHALDRPIEIAFDVGANIGQTSKTILKQFGDCCVFAFEPHPMTFRELSKNISNRRFTPVQLALSDTKGRQTFYEYHWGSVLNSLIPNTRNSQCFGHPIKTTLSVETDTIDDFCLRNHIARIDILKIDTEGNDYAVLKGASRMLNDRAVDFIYFEFNDFVPRAGTIGGGLNEIGAYLSEFGFRFVATYTEGVSARDDMFVFANALMVRV